MFQEIDYLFHFPEKPTDISRDRLFIPFSEKPADISRDTLFIPFPKNQLMFQERLAVLFQNRS